MRIISGEAKGRTLYAPSGSDTRPTSDKIRGSLFNIIGARVMDARVLDLFGGTGALALEALSRGAESAVIADNARAAQQAIDRNARSVLKDDFEYRAQILRSDYRGAISALEGRMFDLVFLDPPYRMVEAYGDALKRLLEADMLAPGCLIVMERLKSASIPLPKRFSVFDTRYYSDTAVDFVEIGAAEI
ncbi:MAG: 16S rRNA (guanine(966)-N(2))-methyltransferase RsmD [Clostridia bacterium]|nr:16S rRNA (guanine(966)-N(2))-methyltransferase RsmD [Clostridia bacterium]